MRLLSVVPFDGLPRPKGPTGKIIRLLIVSRQSKIYFQWNQVTQASFSRSRADSIVVTIDSGGKAHYNTTRRSILSVKITTDSDNTKASGHVCGKSCRAHIFFRQKGIRIIYWWCRIPLMPIYEALENVCILKGCSAMPLLKEVQFASFLDSKNILSHMQATDWKDVIRQLAGLLYRNEGGFELDEVIAACIRREEATSTVIAPRLALPHARVPGLNRVLVAVGTMSVGIPFTLPDQGLIQVVILILTPHEDPGVYLRVLAALTHDLRQPGALDRLSENISSDEIYGVFSANGTQLPSFLKAINLMELHPITLLETESLKAAIDTFCSQQVMDIPIIDDVRDVRGVLSFEDILRHSLPEHLLWMHDLSPILQFEPLAELLKRDFDCKVADCMREEYISVAPEMPAVQLAKIFLTQRVRQILVTDGRQLLGTVDLQSFMAKLFWA